MGLLLNLESKLELSDTTPFNNTSRPSDCMGTDNNKISIVDSTDYSLLCRGLHKLAAAGDFINIAPTINTVRFVSVECDKTINIKFDTATPFVCSKMAILFGEWSNVELVATEDETTVKFVAIGS